MPGYFGESAMILSHSNRFILLAPWKTASQTCFARLGQLDESGFERFFHFNPALGRVVHQHITLPDLLSLPEGQLGYRLASFVRNPYDRAYSGFIQIQRDFHDQPTAKLDPPWIGSLIRAQIAENMARVIAAGFDFDAWLALLPEYEIYEAGRNTNLPLHPAYYWTHASVEVDFIGKVENFEEDFSRFCETVGIDLPPLRNENVTQQPAGEQIRYSRYAASMSRQSIDRINALFARDFELFGYEPL